MKNNSGFTIMELLTAIAIIGIVSAIAVPNLIAWRANQQLGSSVREVLAVINGSRVDAVKNNATVTVTIDAGSQKISSQYTNRLTGADSPPKEVFLRPQIEFVGGDVFTFNSRGFPSKGATFTLRQPGGHTLSVVMSLNGNTRIQ